MTIPNWWETLLLALAAYRVWRLLAEDTILDSPRSSLVGLSDWKAGQPTPVSYRAWLAEFITCPACFGFYISLLFWAAYQAWPHGTVVVAVPFAISTVVIAVASVLSDD
jgi:hypothetical protein